MNGWVTCRQSQKRDAKIPEATKLRRYQLHRIPLNQMNSKELSVWKQLWYELCSVSELYDSQPKRAERPCRDRRLRGLRGPAPHERGWRGSNQRSVSIRSDLVCRARRGT